MSLPGAVFVGTNHNNTSDPQEAANQIAMYRRGGDGQLALIDHFATGGQGSGLSQRFAGDGLGSGNSLRLSQDNRWLFVANAGSDTVSVMEVAPGGLKLVEVAPTGDGSRGHRFPNSVTQHGDLVYVLNAADDGSITGFRLAEDGHLTPLAGSTRMLNANQDRFAPDPLANPTQVAFSPDGAKLIVTIKDGPAAGGDDGSLTLLESVAGETEHPENIQGSTSLDARISQDGRYLYVVLPGSGKVAGWQIGDDDTLAKLGEYGSLPQTVNGDHAPFDFSALGSPAGIEAI